MLDQELNSDTECNEIDRRHEPGAENYFAGTITSVATNVLITKNMIALRKR